MELNLNKLSTANLRASDLSGQHVLVTRAEHQAIDCIQLLKGCGAKVSHLAMFNIVAINEESDTFHQMKHQIMNLDLYDIIICISPNAANIALDWIDQYWPQLPVGINWYAMGRKTAEILKDAGIDAQFSSLGVDSEAMLKLAELQDLTDKKVLILRGSAGRETLRKNLIQRGAMAEYINLYARNKIAYPDALIEEAIYTNKPTSILITSSEGLNNFVTVVSGSKGQFDLNSLRRIKLVVPSARIAEQAKEHGFTQVITAQGPDDIAMITALKSANHSEANV